MLHFEKYIELMKESSPDAEIKAIKKTVGDIVPEHIKTFDFNSHKSGLLLGNVQSGKTGHMLGVLAAAADNGFEIFIVLTAASTHLQEQTFERAFGSLITFVVCNEEDEKQFRINNMRKPVVIVLKKNTNVLEKWKNRLVISEFLNGRPIFIIDDESDAASLNTKINQDDISTINKKISAIRQLSNSSFYLQVTATPQSLFLQDESSGYKPRFVYYFEPGDRYLGGDFFYNTADPYAENQIPFSIRFTGEEELKDLIESELPIPNGMREAIASFLIVAADIHINKSRTSCNFLVHPSVKIKDHEAIAERIGEALNDLLCNIMDDEAFDQILQDEWIDLNKSKPDITDFEKCHSYISDMLEKNKITISVMNSNNTINVDFNKGANIVVGGNSLGRGLTLPNLQTTYYCRKAKRPQADTHWQHARAFGYDRERSLVRIFIPSSLFHLFVKLNDSNNAMIQHLGKYGMENLKLFYPKNVDPTRRSVRSKANIDIISGGVNYFPRYPKDKNVAKFDNILKEFPKDKGGDDVDLEIIKELIKLCAADTKADWPSAAYIDCIQSMQEEKHKKAILIVRRDRNIGKIAETGTLLSPDDRKLGDEISDKVVLTMYKVTGVKWKGKPFWIPNIKLPKGNFHGTKS